MRVLMSRRSFGTLAGTAVALPVGMAAADAATPVQAEAPLGLVAETRTLEVNGKAALVFGVRGPDGRQGLSLAPGQRFRVDLHNQAGVRTIIHWHGQEPPWRQDGFPWPQTPALAVGATRRFDFAPISGTYWMHSHQGLQEQRLMAAPLIIHSAAELREDRQEIVLMLHDFSFEAPDALLAGLTHQPVAQVHDAVRVMENAPVPTHSPQAANVATGMATGPAMGMAMDMGGMAPDLNDINYDAFLANDRTLDDPAVVRVDRRGRVRLRVINGSASSQFWIDLGRLSGRVVAVDGHGVHPVAGRRFPIAIAQRLDILIDLPAIAGAFPILAALEGSTRRTGIILAQQKAVIGRLSEVARHQAPPLDHALEARLVARDPLKPRRADLVHEIALGGEMAPYQWSLSQQYWPAITPLMLKAGQRVEIELVNHTMMAHPMHLHGHRFQVIALDGVRINGAMRDTVLVPGKMGARVRIAFDADNPGRWAFHCHNLYHMAAGMMTEFRYHGIAV